MSEVENETAFMDRCSQLAEALHVLHAQARCEIAPFYRAIMSEIASFHEVESTLGRMLDFVVDAYIDGMFCRVCNHYRDRYPEMVRDYERLRKDILDSDALPLHKPDIDNLDCAGLFSYQRDKTEEAVVQFEDFERISPPSTVGSATMQNDSPPEASPSNGDADQPGAFSLYATMKRPQLLSEQVDHLEAQGLQISEYGRSTVASILAEFNYYRLRGYWLTFQKDGRFVPGTTMSDILEVVQLDRELRKWLLAQIERIEMRTRSRIAYYLGNEYGSLALYEPSAFKNTSRQRGMLQQLSKAIQAGLKARKPFVVHNVNVYGELPVWASVELMTMGVLSKTYGNMANQTLTKAIAADYETTPYYFSSWLEHLTYVRNICAHFDRLYNRTMTKQARLYSGMMPYASNKQFPSFIVVCRLVSRMWPDEWPIEFERLKQVVEMYPGVDLSPMAFPRDWASVLWDVGRCSQKEA